MEQHLRVVGLREEIEGSGPEEPVARLKLVQLLGQAMRIAGDVKEFLGRGSLF